MCLIVFAYRAHSAFPIVVAANRDEYYDRPTKKAHFWESKNSDNRTAAGSATAGDDVFAGEDVREGGMWLGVTKSGKFAAVTNYRDASEDVSSKTKSRGILVADFLKSDISALDYLGQVAPEASLYLGFSVVLGDSTGMYCFSNRGDQQHAPSTVRKLIPGHVYCLSNRLLDDPWPKVLKSKHELSEIMQSIGNIAETELMEKLHSLLKNTSKAPVQQLPTKETGCSEEIEEFLSSIFIESQTYGTRASSAVVVSAPTDANQQKTVCSFTEWSYDKGGGYSGIVSETFRISSSPGVSNCSAASGLRANLETLESKAMGSAKVTSSSGSDLRSHLERLENKLASSGVITTSSSGLRTSLESLENKAMGSAKVASSVSDLPSDLQRLEIKLAASGVVSSADSAGGLHSNLENLEKKDLGSVKAIPPGSELRSNLESLEIKAVESSGTNSCFDSELHSHLQSLEDEIMKNEAKRLEHRLLAGALHADAHTTPGAYSQAPTEEEQIERLERDFVDSEDTPEGAPLGARNASAEVNFAQHGNASNKLIEAKPVLDEENLETGVAFPAPSSTSRMQNQEKYRRRTIRISLVFCLIVVAVVVIVVLTVPENGNDKDEEAFVKAEPTGSPTTRPTAAPTPSPTPYAVELPDFTLQAMKDSESPQSQAYRWLQEDPMLESYLESKLLQRMALATFYYATMGDDWTVGTSWMSYEVDECMWFSKFNVTGEDQVWTVQSSNFVGQLAGQTLCDEVGNYLELVLPNNGLLGTIPKEIAFLSKLARIELSQNKLEGHLPTELGLLTYLRELTIVQRGDMSGTLPTEFGQMMALEYLTLIHLELTGTLPTELGNMASMERLQIRASALTGTIPAEISKMSNLVQLGAFCGIFHHACLCMLMR